MACIRMSAAIVKLKIHRQRKGDGFIFPTIKFWKRLGNTQVSITNKYKQINECYFLLYSWFT